MSLHRNTDQLFKDQLKDHKISPPTEVWNRIENSLDNKSKKRILPILFYAAASIALIVGVISLNNLSSDLSNNTIDSNLIAESNQPSITSNTTSNLKSKNNNTTFSKNADINNNHLNIKKSVKSDINSNENAHRKVKYKLLQPNYILSSKIKASVPSSKNIVIPAKFARSYLYNSNNQNLLQQQGEELNRGNDIAITALVSPEYAYRSANSSNINKTDQYSESGISNIAGGINITVKTPKRWSFVTGVFITNAGQNIAANITTQTSYVSAVEIENRVIAQSKTVVADNTLGELEFNNLSYSNNDIILRSPSLGKVNTETIKSDIDIQQEVQFLEIPFSAKFNIIESKPIVSISAGLCTNFLIDNNASFSSEGNSINGKTNNLKDVSYSSKFGIGIEYPVFKRVSINIEPVFRYFISSVSKSKEINYHPYNIGLNAGLSYKFQ